MAVRIRLRSRPTIEIDVGNLSENALREVSPAEWARLPIRHGSTDICAGELFDIEGNLEDGKIIWSGIDARVHQLGKQNDSATMIVEGSVGDRLGAGMTGGRITVHGNVGALVGSQMTGGMIEVHGDAGNFAGAAENPNRRGQAGGTLVIRGSAGHHAGYRMRRGLMVIAENAADMAGAAMLAGTVAIGGACGADLGIGMRRGTLALFSPASLNLFHFARACQATPLAARLVLEKLHTLDMPTERISAAATVFNGDLLEGGRGEVWQFSSL